MKNNTTTIKYWTQSADSREPVANSFSGTPEEAAAFSHSLIGSHPQSHFDVHYFSTEEHSSEEARVEFVAEYERIRSEFCKMSAAQGRMAAILHEIKANGGRVYSVHNPNAPNDTGVVFGPVESAEEKETIMKELRHLAAVCLERGKWFISCRSK